MSEPETRAERRVAKAGSTGRKGFRPEIQALRALAMAGVVLFHLWPLRMSGGYIGVDVFFVISGYLISSHLLREVESTGTIRLSQFYARRIRRLLPASMLVLALTAIATALLVPSDTREPFLIEAAAAGLYVVNWVLANHSVDYFAAVGPESPVQHYWSLSVEEQFYLVWPLLFLLVAALAARAMRRRTLAIVMASVFVACLVYSIIATAVAPQFTYFSSPAHAWEFAAGGMLALAQRRIDASRWHERRHARAALLWVGLATITATFFLFGPETPVPGWIAIIPTAGTIAVILAERSDAAWSPTRLLSWRPVQFAGDISYAAYLWHWPIIVLLPYAIARELTTLDKVLILATTVLLSWATRRWIEQAAIRGAAWRRRRMSYGFAIVSAALVVVLCVVPIVQTRAAADQALDDVVSQVSGDDACAGAPALTDPEQCEFAHELDPEVEAGSAGYEAIGMQVAEAAGVDATCGTSIQDSEVCTFGDGSEDAPTIALVGDSHAEHLIPPLAYQAGAMGATVEVFTKRSCPMVVDSWLATGDAIYKQNDPDCLAWRAEIIEQIADDPDIDVVVVATYAHRVTLDGTQELQDSLTSSFAETWDILTEAGKSVVVVGDTPLASSSDTAACLAEGPAIDCANDPDAALPADPMAESVDEASDAQLLDLTDAFCDEEHCYAAVGGMQVYADDHHIAPAFSLTLAPWFTVALERALD